MNLFPIEKRFVRYLTEKKFSKFPIMGFSSVVTWPPKRWKCRKSSCASNGSTFGFLRDRLPVDIALWRAEISVLAILAPLFRVSGNLKNGRCQKKCYQSRANFFWADGTGPGSIGGLAVALSPETVLVPDEKRIGAGFSSLDIPFSTWRFLDCRDPGCAPRNEERWPWVAARL